MSKTTDIQTAKPTGDVVLQEIWRIKDALSASYGHDVDRRECVFDAPDFLEHHVARRLGGLYVSRFAHK